MALTVGNHSRTMLLFAHMHRGGGAPAGSGIGWCSSFANSSKPWHYETPFGLTCAFRTRTSLPHDNDAHTTSI